MTDRRPTPYFSVTLSDSSVTLSEAKGLVLAEPVADRESTPYFSVTLSEAKGLVLAEPVADRESTPYFSVTLSEAKGLVLAEPVAGS